LFARATNPPVRLRVLTSSFRTVDVAFAVVVVRIVPATRIALHFFARRTLSLLFKKTKTRTATTKTSRSFVRSNARVVRSTSLSTVGKPLSGRGPAGRECVAARTQDCRRRRGSRVSPARSRRQTSNVYMSV
jgi:hypothetical protein